MADVISSRTPEGSSNHCPVCEKRVTIEPSRPPGDAPCPNCGTLLWFGNTSSGPVCYESEAVAHLRERLLRTLGENLGVKKDRLTDSTPFTADVGADSLDLVELVMELEEEFDIHIPEEDIYDFKTVGDVLAYLASRGL